MSKVAFTVVIALAIGMVSAQFNPGVKYSYKPYNFAYDITGDDGSTSSRSEQADGSGNVRGSYSYRGPLGIFRIVDYIADSVNGFQATIRTNEPGTDNQDPADVKITAETPPAGAYEHRYQYSRPGIVARPRPTRFQ